MARTDEPTPADIKAQYGFVALIGKEVPEIRNLLSRAVKEKWTAQRFSMAVADTGWWRGSSAQQREWLVRTATDPATAAQELNVGGDMIRNQAKALGFDAVSKSASQSIWLHSKINGYSDSHVNAEIFRRLQPKQFRDPLQTAQRAGGRYGELMNQMFSDAVNYGYIVGDWRKNQKAVREIWHQANRIMQTGGESNAEEWKTKMISYASSKYAPFSDRIRAGETVVDIAQPYIETVSDLLELNPNDIGLNDKLMKQALQGTGSDGQAMAVWQLEKAARQDQRWRTTDNARDAAAKMATDLGRMFGKMA